MIEAKAIEYIREMQEYTVSDNVALYRAENDCKKQYMGEKQAMIIEADAAEYKRKKAEYSKRSTNSVVTAGRKTMSISKKAETKKVEKEAERDEDAENMLKYLGEVAVEIVE